MNDIDQRQKRMIDQKVEQFKEVAEGDIPQTLGELNHIEKADVVDGPADDEIFIRDNDEVAIVEFFEKRSRVPIKELEEKGFDDPTSMIRRMKAERQAAIRGFKLVKRGDSVKKLQIKEEGDKVRFPDEKEQEFFWHPPESNLIRKYIEMDENVLLTGPTGCGKSELAERICEDLDGEKPIFVEMAKDLNGDDLFGTVSLEDGDTVVELGPIAEAMRQGRKLLIEEIDAGSPEILFRLHNPMLGKPMNLTKQGTEVIKPKPGFQIIATANTIGRGDETGRYVGTTVLNEAFLDRFGASFEMDYPPRDKEKKIIQQRTNIVDEDIIDGITQFAQGARDLLAEGKIFSTFSVRKSLNLAKSYANGIPVDDAIEVVILNKVKSTDEQELRELKNRVFG